MIASAYERQTQYRIYGDEIARVMMPDIEMEDPMSLVIITKQSRDLLIESDQPLDECAQNLMQIQGDANAFVQIIVDETADTMNGVEVIACSILYR